MSNLEKEIEALIAERKRLEKQVIAENDKDNLTNLSKVEDDNSIDLKKVEIKDEQSIAIRKKILRHLRDAKMSHKKWMSNVQILIRLGDVEMAKSSIPINYTLCDFGKWYHGDGQVLSGFPEYIKMGETHKNVHDTYLQIYELYDKKIKGSLFNSKKSQIEVRNKKALDLSKVLDEYSKIMYELLVLGEGLIKRMSDQEILNLDF